MLKTKLAIVVLTLSMSITIYAQSEQIKSANTDTPVAILSNSYGDFDKEHVRSMLDEYLASLNRLRDSTGIVVVRGTLDEVIERKLFVANHIFDTKFDNLRVRFKVIIDDKEKKTEFWIIPKGACEPKVSQTAWVGLEIGEESDGDAKKKTKEFFDKVFHLRWEVEFFIFNYGSDAFVENRRKVLASNLERVPEFPDPRITFVDAGVSKGNLTVIWLVPFGADLPKP